jgi:predicted regulator of Ras-like GTPase activity (Roadblock/LC7/MglB family)
VTVRAPTPALSDLARVRGVRGVLLTSLGDALPIESTAHVDVDIDALAAFATALYRRAWQAAACSHAGEVRLVSLEAAQGRLAAASHGDLLLVVLAERETNPGLLRVSLQRALEALA